MSQKFEKKKKVVKKQPKGKETKKPVAKKSLLKEEADTGFDDESDYDY